MKSKIMHFFFILLFVSPCLLNAADLDLEKGLQRELLKSFSMVEKAIARVQDGDLPATEIASLKASAEDILASHMLMKERFEERAERTASMGSTASGRQTEMSSRYIQTIEEYLSLINDLPSAENVSIGELNQSRDLLDKILYRKSPPIYGSLPYKPLNYPAREPIKGPSITAAYQGGNKAVSPEDLKGGHEAPITAEIAALAESLGWNPVLIYEWVKNNVETEWYWGCMKGAEETMRQKSGNDCDQAALLVSLLRASGFPSRYVLGMIEFFPGIETVKNLTGIEQPENISEFFRKAGIPAKPIIAGGKISNFQIEHIWVESLIPFANFHGAMVDEHGKAWLGLDTSIKVTGYSYNEAVDINDWHQLSGIRQDYLSGINGVTPLEYVQSELGTYLEQNHPDTTYEGLLRKKTLIPESLNILPASLQFKQILVTNEYAGLPEELIHKVRFVASDTGNNKIMDIALDAFTLSNRQIAITYEPETVEDQEIINSNGGLDNTPAYLVRLRPTLEIDKKNVAVSTDGLAIGADYYLKITLISPNGEEKFTNTLITGNYAVIGIACQKAVMPGPVPDEDINAYRLLHETALDYINRWNQSEEELASLLHLSITRPLPTVVTLGGVMDVTYLLDTPQGFEWKGLYVDADLRTIEAIDTRQTADDNGQSVMDFMRLSGLQGSVLENTVLENAFQVESISTAKLIQLANDQQIQVLTIDKDNLESVLPGLVFSDAVKEDITNAVNQGLAVMIPQTEISYENWRGIGYLKEDPKTGASGWMLSGMIAGGMTAGDWSEDLLALFGNPYSQPPNNNPAEAKYIHIIAKTNMQKGKAGDNLPNPLQVMVLDTKGKPVKGAAVTFTIRSGGGQVTPAGSVLTDYHGIASVDMTLGQKTGDNPTYVKPAANAFYWQQVGENIIDASLDSTGASIPRPFTAYGFPEEPANMRKISGDQQYGEILSFAGFVTVVIEDMYGNPISNLPVDFQVRPAIELSSCANPNKDTRPALLIERDDPCIAGAAFPTWGECASSGPQLQELTDSLGAAPVHIILGGIPGAEYPIEAQYQTLSQTFSRYANSFGNCQDANAEPDMELRIEYIYPADNFGNNIDGVETGKKIPLRVRLFYQRENESLGSDCNGACPKVVGARQYGMDVNFKSASVTVGGQQCANLGNGIFECLYEVQSGLNTISIDGTATVTRNKFLNNCPTCGSLTSEDVSRNANTNMLIYGIDTDVELGPEDYILVDRLGYTLKDYTLTTTVVPASYQAANAYLVILKDGVPIQYVSTGNSGQGIVTLLKGYYFDISSSYSAQLLLNAGHVAQHGSLEILSQPIPLKVIGTEVSAGNIRLVTNIDRINGDICAETENLVFSLSDDADVTIEVDGAVINQTIGSQTIPIQDVHFAAGENKVLISRDMVPLPGEHDFKITAVFSQANPHIESVANGKIIHNITIDAFLPVGHTFVKGVDIQDGHLAISREDLSLPGIGPELSFARSYGSTGSNSSGVVGAGWTHNYNVRLVTDSCQRITVAGGEGSGTRFSNPVSENGDQRYQPQAGYHGRLLAHPDGSYDYYTKGGMRHHFEQSPDASKANEYTLRFIEDTNQNQLVLNYEAAPPYNLTSVQSASGSTLNFEYGSYGSVPESRITKITGPMGLEMKYDYDPYGNLVKAARDVKIETYEYTTTQKQDRHNLKKTIDPNGGVTEYIYYTQQESISGYPANYDWNSHILIYPEKYEYVKTVKEASGAAEETGSSFLYDYVNDKRTVKNGRGFDVQYTLNSYGCVIVMEDPLGNRDLTTWAMDVGINDVYVVDRTDHAGHKTSYQYDANGNTTRTVDASGNVSDAVYNLAINTPIRITDANLHTTNYSYDGSGNLLEIRDALGNITRHTYDTHGNRISTTNANGFTTTFTYDFYGNVISITFPDTSSTSNTYDLRGRLTRATDASGHHTDYVYDELDRRIKSTDHLGNATLTAFDANGNKISETNPRGFATTYAYDSLNRLVQETDALGHSKSYFYDKNSNQIKETDKKGQSTLFTYDAAEMLTKQINAAGKEMTAVYDAVGNKIEEKDFNGHSTQYAYDAMNRLIRTTDALGNVTWSEYDNVGNKTKDIDANLNETRYVYDAGNRLTSATDALGNTAITAYDADGNKVSETDRKGHTTLYAYDSNNRLVSITDPLGYSVSYTYDPVGNKLMDTNQNGHSTLYAYDALNRLLKKTDPEGFSIESTYDPAGNIIKTIDCRGFETLQEYDGLNRITRVTVNDPNTSTPLDMSYTYDANGNRISETNRRGFTCTYDYDQMNREIFTTDPIGNKITHEYDAQGNKNKVIDRKGIASTFTYDDADRLVEENRGGVRVRSMVYDGVGNVIEETDVNGHTRTSQYNEVNQLIRKIAPDNTVTFYTYDPEGNVLTEVNPEGHTTTMGYDAADRLITLEDPEQNVTRTFYDNVGNKIRVEEPKGASFATVFEYDKNNRLTRVVDALGNTTQYDHDGNGNVTAQTDPNGHQVTYDYDSLNRQIRLTQKKAGGDLITEFTYDANGNRTGLKDPKGQTFSFTYDALDRLTLKAYPAPSDPVYPYLKEISYTHDDNNNPVRIDEIKVLSAGGNTRAEITRKGYDHFDRLIEEINRDGKHITYAYDPAGNRTSVTDPDNVTTTYTYDSLNRLATVQTTGGTTTSTYYPDGMKQTVLYPNNTRADYTYDKSNRLTAITNSNNAGTVSLYEYTYDENGNRLTMEETQDNGMQATSYQYDLINRLVQVSYPADTQYPNGRNAVYTYDNAGNRLSEIETDSNNQTLVSRTYSYNEVNWLTVITDNLGADSMAFVYDANGNNVSKTKSGIATTYAYDVKDYLRSVRRGNAELAGFDYDYQGMRVNKTGSDGEIRYIYDGNSVILETNATGNTIAKYDYGDQLISLSHVDQGTQYYHFSGLGSTADLTNADGSVRCRYQYDAWGNFRRKSDQSWNKKTFTGKEWDEETGLYYFGARFYDPEIGRFINQDAYMGEVNSPPSLHRYLYAHDNPLRLIDPTGHAGISVTSWSDNWATYHCRRGNYLSGFGWWFLGRAMNSVTFGFLSHHDPYADKYYKGQMDGTEYGLRTLQAAGKSAAVGAVSLYTGGVAGRLGAAAVGEMGGGLIAQGMGGGLAGGSTAAVTGLFTGDTLASVESGKNQFHSLGEYGEAFLQGGTVGLAGGGLGGAAVKLKTFGLKGGGGAWDSQMWEAGVRRLRIMSKMEGGSSNWQATKQLEAGLKTISSRLKAMGQSGELEFTGAKFKLLRGANPKETTAFNPAELYEAGIISKAGMHARILAQRAANLGKNLFTQNSTNPVVATDPITGELYLKGDIDVISGAKVIQGHTPRMAAIRHGLAEFGNQAAGKNLFDTFKPNHGVLPEVLPNEVMANGSPKPFLAEPSPPGQPATSRTLFSRGNRINDAAKGEVYVGAREMLQWK